MKTLNGNEAISFGFKAVTSNIIFFIGISLAIFLVTVILPDIVFGNGGHDRGLLPRIIIWLLSSYATLGLASVALRTVDKKNVSYQDFFRVTHLFVPYAIATVVVQFATTIGLILLVVPGVIVALMWMFYGYFILDKGLQPIEALKASAALTKGYRWNLFGIGILLFLLNCVGILLFGIGLLLTIPVTVVAIAHMYRQLS